MRQRYGRRSQFLAAIFALFALGIVVQMTRIQNSPEAETFRQLSQDYAYEWRTFYPRRGEIYDRNGYLLAGEKIVYEVGVDLNMMTDAHAIAYAVADALDLNYDNLMSVIQNPPEGLSYIVLADYVEGQQATYLQDLKKALNDQAADGTLGGLTGLQFKSHPQRSYPEDTLASNLLGFVNRENKGYFGVEEKYDSLLAGNPVTVLVPTNPNKAFEIPNVPDGTTLILTINRDLQAATEEILDNALRTYGAKDGVIAVMNPQSGEILAAATSRRMDLNEFWNYASVYDNATEFDPIISKAYEPGSVTKILTMAAALDSGAVEPETTYIDTGEVLIGGVTIQNWDRNPWGVQNMVGCLQHSLNVCMVNIASKMGANVFYSYMDAFGFGHLSGVDLAWEASGRLKIPGDSDWYPVDLGTNAFGQGMAATPIQIMTAASAIANNGRMVVPHILYAMARDGRQYKVPDQFGASPISAQTAHTLTDMLAVSLESESSVALVEGYRVAGKTGTAQVPVNGYYDASQTNASFIGWGPVDDPQFMIYVWLETPTASQWGSETAAPVFAEVAQRAAILLNIPPDAIRLQLVKK